MLKSKKRKTGRKKITSLKYVLTLRLMMLIIPIFLIYNFLGYSTQRKNLIESNTLLQNQVEYSIVNAITMSNSGYNLLSKSLDDTLKTKMMIFADEYKKAGSPEKLNLDALRESLGGKLHLYINDETGITRYATNKDDIGFDYKNLKEFYEVLQKRRQGNEFASDPFVTSQNSNVLTKYAYMPTENHKDLLQISVTSEDFKDMLQEVDYNKVVEDVKKTSNVSSIRVFGSRGKLINDPSLAIDDNIQKIVQNVAESQKNYIDNSKKYIYVGNGYGPTTGDVRKIVEITYNTDDIDKALFSYTVRQGIITVISIALLAFIILIISSKTINPLIRLQEGIDKIAEGDLTVKFDEKGKGEINLISQSMNKMAENMLNLIININSSAKTTAEATDRLNYSFEEISKAVEQTTSSTVNIASEINDQGGLVSETANQVEIVGEGIKLIKSNIDSVSTLVDNVIAKSDSGMSSIENTVDQMKNIKTSTEEVRDLIEILDKSSSEISGITSSIEAIAEQTHLLSLNASIEAARAGESGRGFAVVASEVGKLAEQSSNSAKIIKDLITKNQHNTKLAVEAMEKGVDSVAKGEEIAESAGIAFKSITDLISDTRKNIDIISSNSYSLENNRELISKTIENLTSISDEIINETNSTAATTEEQSASIQEVSAFAHTLSNMAENLIHDIEKFKI